MAVYFLYRCGYLRPMNVLVRRYEDATVVDWFRRHWPGKKELPRTWHDHAVEALGLSQGEDASGLVCAFAKVAEEGRLPPKTMEDVAAALELMYCTAMAHEDHCAQVLGDDDEIDMAYCFFDDEFLRDHGDLAAYPLPLLDNGWRLPDGAGKGRSKKGKLYCSHQILHDGSNLCDLDESSLAVIKGARVPDLCRVLMGMTEDEDNTNHFPYRLREELLSGDLVEDAEERAFLAALRADPADEVTWGVYSDWLAERGERSPTHRLLGRALPRIPAAAAGPHLIQVGDHVVQFIDEDGAHWFAFDDLWSAALPALAKSLLRYATRWDMLSTGSEERDD